jgi:predicted nucleic acid-binding protein
MAAVTALVADALVSAVPAAYDLSVYDAAYLELAQRRHLVLACTDGPLRDAARRCGVKGWTRR